VTTTVATSATAMRSRAMIDTPVTVSPRHATSAAVAHAGEVPHG